ncbi:hypothetical protein BGZ60DRAFT_534999 [Tricladium varicosporioides]|nr:hypothetical protein BGZ60DRAFT_534999 [Hymenoscyphus varicosporioides]
MGNEQSAPAPRRTNKLSKPRTNSSGNLLNTTAPGLQVPQGLQSTASSPTKSRYSLVSIDGSGDTENEWDKKTKRRSLFRSRSSQAQARARQLEITTGINFEFVEPSPVETPVERPMRRRSLTTGGHADISADRSHSQRGRNMRMSLPYAPYPHHNPRLSYVEEVQTPALDQALPARTNSIYGQSEKDASTNPRLSISSRTNSDTALFGPIRRRSLLQHGVATRTSFAESDPRQSLPSQIKTIEDLRDYYYNPEKPTSSPLSSLAALGYDTKENVPGQRVQTPNDLDYGHIGAFKLGSLRITNGAASPAPSEGRPSTAGADDDYLTFKKQGQSKHRYQLSERSNTLAVPSEAVRTPWVTRAESPLRQEHEIKPEPLTIKTQLRVPDPSLALFDFQNKHSPTKSLELAKEYMQDLASSPFSFTYSPVPSPKLEPTSKHMAVDDDLFAPEPTTPTIDPPVRQSTGSFDSGYEPAESTGPKGPREFIPKPLAKADSGYSSNISLRSFKKDTGPPVPAKDAPQCPPRETFPRIASSTYSESPSEIQPERSLPALPTEFTPPPSRQAPQVPPKQPASHQSANGPAPDLPQKSEARPHIAELQRHNRQRSLPTPPRGERISQDLQTRASNESMFSKGAGTRGNKVQKPRPQTMQPSKPTPIFTVQATPTPSEVIRVPPVPLETQQKLVERVEAFPGTCFPNTFSNFTPLKRSVSKETLGTIFSVGSAEVRDEISFARLQGKLPPVPASIPEHPAALQQKPIPERKSVPVQMVTPQPKPPVNRRATFQASSSGSMPFWKSFDRRRSMKSQSREQSPAPRKSIEQQREEFEARITSFDAVSASLGKSPYDLGMNAICRPQSSNANARAKSMTAQFEAEAASRFQRSRNVSQESQGSSFLQRRSYESITAGNPFASGTSTASYSKKNSREYPPQAHMKHSSWKPYSAQSFDTSILPPHVQEINKNRHSSPFPLAKKNTSPPVSMQTRRAPSNKKPPPPSRTPPAAPIKATPAIPTQAPQAPSRISNQTVQTSHDPWAEHKNYWPNHRKSAGEALQTRKSIEVQRPNVAAFNQQHSYNSMATRSIDSRRPSSSRVPVNPTFETGMSIRRTESARPEQGHRERQYTQWDNHGYGNYNQPQTWTGHSAQGYSSHIYTTPQHNYSAQWEETQSSAQYDHTYGSRESSVEPELEYFDQPTLPEFSSFQPDLSHSVHARQNSTEDMLVLDRFSGGLGYNYELGYGARNTGKLAGGSKKRVEVSRMYGADFSDAPVILQSVPVGGR